MRLAVLTSVETRHRFVANRLRAAFPVVAAAYERTGYAPAAVHGDELSPREIQIVAEHFAERARQEDRFFGHDCGWIPDRCDCAVRLLEPGGLNRPATLEFLERAGVDTVAVFGTNLIREPLLSRYAGRMLNLHLGLSPYYRGTATNFYPLLNEEPEYGGATIHLVDAGIDSGPILRHARPTIVAEDMPHTIGCKAILAGMGALMSALTDLEAGRTRPVTQWTVPDAKVYYRKDYHPRQVVELYRKLEAGLIPRYVGRAAQAASSLRLIT